MENNNGICLAELNDILWNENYDYYDTFEILERYDILDTTYYNCEVSRIVQLGDADVFKVTTELTVDVYSGRVTFSGRTLWFCLLFEISENETDADRHDFMAKLPSSVLYVDIDSVRELLEKEIENEQKHSEQGTKE